MADEPTEPNAEELVQLMINHEQSRDLCQRLFTVVCEHGQENDLGPVVILSACAELLGTVLAFPMIYTPELTEKTLNHVREMVKIMNEPESAREEFLKSAGAQ